MIDCAPKYYLEVHRDPIVSGLACPFALQVGLNDFLCTKYYLEAHQGLIDCVPVLLGLA